MWSFLSQGESIHPSLTLKSWQSATQINSLIQTKRFNSIGFDHSAAFPKAEETQIGYLDC